MANITYTLDADMAKAVDGFLKLVESQNKAERQFKKTTRAAKKQDKALTDIHKSIKKMVLAVGGIYAIKRAFDATVGTGFKFNQTLETSKLGIASLISANYDMVTADGKRLEGLEKINAAQGSAKKLQDDLRIAGLKTTATYEQLVFAFQTAFAPGSAVGLGMDQIQQLTVQITQAAGAIGLPMNQLAEEIRSIFQGTITPRNTRIATALGITNEDIRNWKKAGTLFEELTKQFGTFSDAGILAEQTWGGVSSNLIDAAQQVLGEGFKPLFEYTKKEALELMDYLVTIEDGVVELNPDLVQFFDTVSNGMIMIGRAASTTAKIVNMLGPYARAFTATAPVGGLWPGSVLGGGGKGGEIYQPGTRMPIPARPRGKSGASDKLGVSSSEYAAYQRQMSLFGASFKDPYEEKLERERISIEKQYASLLEKAQGFENSKALIADLGIRKRDALEQSALEISAERAEDVLKETERREKLWTRMVKDELTIRRDAYQSSWDLMMQANAMIGGEAGLGMGQFMAGAKGQADIGMGVDPLSLELERLQAFHEQKMELLRTASEEELMLKFETAERAALMQQEMGQQSLRQESITNQLRLASYANTGNMIMGVLGAMQGFIGKHNKALFLVQKAAAIAITLVNAHAAAVAAVAPPPLGYGPNPVGIAMAAKMLTFGYLQAALIGATAISSLSQKGATGYVGGTSSGGYAYEEPMEPAWVKEPSRSLEINFHIYGNVVDHDAFAREMMPSIQKAVEDNV